MRYIVLLALTLAACGRPAPEANIANQVGSTEAPPVVAPTTPTPMRDYAGRWTGVEGMYLVVTPSAGDAVGLEMQWDLDHHGTVAGKRVGDTIAFVRDGKAEALRPTDGDATGLKYLAGKKDCLTVKPGEGYCRD